MLKFNFQILDLDGHLLEETGCLAAVKRPVVVGQGQAEIRDKRIDTGSQILRTRDNRADTEDGALRCDQGP